jgi:hypothetical protein
MRMGVSDSKWNLTRPPFFSTASQINVSVRSSHLERRYDGTLIRSDVWSSSVLDSPAFLPFSLSGVRPRSR